ncbi:hypothetical protein [Actinomadura alba]|uniref:hypothetical protein n=1 Tax=Actinomadura alba TaxID=406431 RepID=UPI001C9BFEFB|nr:hypothetical protein [Actinomadura alba]
MFVVFVLFVVSVLLLLLLLLLLLPTATAATATATGGRGCCSLTGGRSGTAATTATTTATTGDHLLRRRGHGRGAGRSGRADGEGGCARKNQPGHHNCHTLLAFHGTYLLEEIEP